MGLRNYFLTPIWRPYHWRLINANFLPEYLAYGTLPRMRTDALNLRYLLWREGVSRERWREQLADWMGTPDLARAEEVLAAGGLSVDEADSVGRRLRATAEDLLNSELFAQADIVIENIGFLLGTLEHGGKKQIAEALGVDQTTISRWIGGKIRPGASRQRELEKVLGLPDGRRLDEHPFFLMDEPSSDQARRQWLQERVKHMDSADLRSLFPALQRLLDK